MSFGLDIEILQLTLRFFSFGEKQDFLLDEVRLISHTCSSSQQLFPVQPQYLNTAPALLRLLVVLCSSCGDIWPKTTNQLCKVYTLS